MKKNQKRIWIGLAALGGVAGGYFLVRALRQMLEQDYFGKQEDWGQLAKHNPPSQMPQTMRRQLGPVTERERAAEPLPTPGYQPQDQPDRQPIPQTGVGMHETAALGHDVVLGDAQPELVQDGAQLATMLIQHLLAFSELMKLLRQRREAATTSERSLTPEDRGRLDVVLNRLNEAYTDLGEGFFEEGSLRERIYRLAAKTRDAMQNSAYDDSDLFRINGEVRPEACRLLTEIRSSGMAPAVNQDEVREEYRCV
jgi:hypothetical protein